ncbi:MAG: STAS domain-containing protein [Burkholderiales bacterium]|nr:STAS domain-containing protein [Burkholderiales bacterium]
MATKDDRPGLLSKVAKFVRNPTKDWSELDNPDQPQESGYDKQALKAMIERKRQNDFVRKREFDQLRKLRNRDPVAMANMARPSFFQSSVATDPDGRAVTLKKIDEIEAQMSKQWWKGKQEGTTRNTDLAVARDSRLLGDSQGHSSSQYPTQAPAHSPHHFAPTEAVGLRATPDSNSGELHSTQMPTELASLRAAAPQGYAVAPSSAEDQSFSTSELFAIEVDDMTTDPELEEAAIRFANGDDAGAEKGLLVALRGEAVQPEIALSWAAALLDLYRATGNRTQFESAVQEFRVRFGPVAPSWATVPGPSVRTVKTLAGGGGRDVLIWDSPAVLDLHAMEALRTALSSSPTPWYVGWGRLESVTADAVPLLNALFESLCGESVALRFSGADRLVQRLRAMTPSGDRAVDRGWWQVRLNALRSMHLIDEFELAALDFCVTFEVAPPAWVEARCQYESTDSGAASSADAGAAGGPELRGEILGDATQLLAELGSDAQTGATLEVSCRNLVRVDFSAAGSILNWVTQRQADGANVQFRDVHRLVAAFFNVIGINEYARVIPRTI